jgi:hypothetical protein
MLFDISLSARRYITALLSEFSYWNFHTDCLELEINYINQFIDSKSAMKRNISLLVTYD